MTLPAPNSPAPTIRATLRVTVLRGGPGAEREISLASGEAVADALRGRGHQVFEADIDRDHLAALDHDADVVFPALHGVFGEDGSLQRILEERGIPFVGSGSAASALAMDKVAAKERVARLDLDTPEFQLLTKSADLRLSTPLIVKPRREGSSVATCVARDREQAAGACETVIETYGEALVERFISGDELTVGIYAGRALPPICVRPRRGFYDFDAKYRDDRTEYLFDAGYTAEALERVQALSLRVFRAFGCRDLGRVDWMMDSQQKAWFLELNTLPGFTSHSLVPKAAAHCGIAFSELTDGLVRLAMEDHA